MSVVRELRRRLDAEQSALFRSVPAAFGRSTTGGAAPLRERLDLIARAVRESK
jgi:hypothetical protein